MPVRHSNISSYAIGLYIIEFLWAMADGDGLAQDQDAPTVVRGISRDDLAGMESMRSNSSNSGKRNSTGLLDASSRSPASR